MVKKCIRKKILAQVAGDGSRNQNLLETFSMLTNDEKIPDHKFLFK